MTVLKSFLFLHLLMHIDLAEIILKKDDLDFLILDLPHQIQR
jgi:hypothetical protein